MRRALGFLLVILSVCVALLGLSARLGRDAALTAATVDSLAAVDEARDYLSVTRGANHTLTDAMKALLEDEELPLKVMKTGKDAADWSKRIEALDLGPEDSLVWRMVQLDAVSLLKQGTDGRYRLVRVEALLEDSVIRNGDNALSRIVTRRGYQHWKEVHVFEAPEGAMGFDATTSRDALHQTGTLSFVEGDWATYRNGQPVLLRLVEVPRDPGQKAPKHELKTALVSLKGPRMLVRSVGAAPLEHQLSVPEQAR